jgi:hypothetical protein
MFDALAMLQRVVIGGGDGTMLRAVGARVAIIYFAVDILRSILQRKSSGRIVGATRPNQTVQVRFSCENT